MEMAYIRGHGQALDCRGFRVLRIFGWRSSVSRQSVVARHRGSDNMLAAASEANPTKHVTDRDHADGRIEWIGSRPGVCWQNRSGDSLCHDAGSAKIRGQNASWAVTTAPNAIEQM